MSVFGWFAPGPAEMLVILMLGVLLFGKRLPEVGKNIGKGLLEFKKGVNDIKEGKVDDRSTPPPLQEESMDEETTKFTPSA